jgi:hypothetical protein
VRPEHDDEQGQPRAAPPAVAASWRPHRTTAADGTGGAVPGAYCTR